MSEMPHEITQAYLRTILDYDPETGLFTWRPRHPDRKGWNLRRAGTTAGTLMRGGYVSINLFDVPRYAHRLAFIWMTGEVPEMVDHRDRDRSNNRWANLRAADNSRNLANATLRSDNVSGVKGVCWYGPLEKWHAQVHKDGERIHLGYFDDKAAAEQAYATAAKRLFGEFYRPF